MTADDSTLADRIGAVEAEARQRYRRRLLFAGPVAIAVAVGLVVAGVALGESGHQPRHGHLNSVAVLIVAVAMLVVAGVVLALSLRHGRAQFKPSLLLGLDKPDRRRAARGLRRGQPDDDLLVREVQVRAARRFLVQGRHNLWLFPVLATLQAVIALTRSDDGVSWVPFAGFAVFFLVMWPVALAQQRGARSIVRQACDDSGE